jgi:hypothetical protein
MRSSCRVPVATLAVRPAACKQVGPGRSEAGISGESGRPVDDCPPLHTDLKDNVREEGRMCSPFVFLTSPRPAV